MKYEKVVLEIDESVTGKARPRMNTTTGKAYTPTKTKNYEYLVRQLFIYNYPHFELYKGRVKAKIIVHKEIPASKSKKIQQQMITNEISPTVKPDVDNIIKIILDSLNKFAYVDDCQVTKLEIEKFYAEKPKVIVELSEY